MDELEMLTEAYKKLPKLEPIPDTMLVPKLRIDYFGPSSVVYVKGIAIGKGVERVEYRHEAGKPGRLVLDCDIDSLQFLVQTDPASGGETPEAGSDG